MEAAAATAAQAAEEAQAAALRDLDDAGSRAAAELSETRREFN